MNCPNCNTAADETDLFCRLCGCSLTDKKRVEDIRKSESGEKFAVQPDSTENSEDTSVNTETQYIQPIDNKLQAKNLSEATPDDAPTPASVLTFGILSVAIPGIFAVLAIVFGIIARKKAAAYKKLNTVIPPRVRVGGILGTVGFICGIVVSARILLIAFVFIFYYVVMFLIMGLSIYGNYLY